MPDEKFKLPGSSYDELCKIIQAYAKTDKPSSLKEITQQAGLHETIVSRNNKFLLSTGLIEGGKEKASTERGKNLGLALLHSKPEEIQNAWRGIVEENEFLSKMVSAIRIRKGMDTLNLRSHIAYSAGQPKTPSIMAGAGAVVEILSTSGLVVREGDTISPADLPELQGPKEPEIPIPKPAQGLKLPDASVDVPQNIKGVSFSLHVEVRINANSSEIENLAPKLRKLIDDLSSAKEKNEQ